MTSPSGRSAVIRRSSELSRYPAKVFAEAENQPITVTRRDGESLVLMSQREADARAGLLQLAAKLITVALDDGALEDRMAAHFPWMLALSEVGRARCSRALIDAARASFATDQPHLAILELASWRETAEAIAAGLRSEPDEWSDDDDLAAQL